MLLWLVSVAFAGPHIHVRDLDPAVVPSSIEFSLGRLYVDGAKVRGSRHDQLDYVAAVVSDTGGVPAALRIEQRHRALRQRGAAAALSTGASAAGVVTMVVFPPAILPVCVGSLVVHGATGVVALNAQRNWNQRELERQVAQYHAFASIALP